MIDYKALFQKAPGCYLVLSPDFQIIEVSDGYLERTMTKREQLLGQYLFDAFPDNPKEHDFGKEHLSQSLREVIRTGKPHQMVIQKYDIQKPAELGGAFEERFWSPQNIPVFDVNGELQFIIHSVEDVTEQVRIGKFTEKQNKLPLDLRTSDPALAAVIVDEMYQFVALLDREGRLLEVNRPALLGTGLNMSDIRGQFMWEVPVWNVTPENFIKVRESSLRGCRGEFVREELLLFAAAGGKEAVTIDFSIKPVRDENGKILFVLAEGRNITEKKIAEAELEQKSRELLRLNEKLLDLDRLKTEFFANVSHELRTPLSLILGPVQKRLAANNLAAEEQRDLELIERNARLLLKHVNDLLDISKLEAGAMALDYSECDIAWLARYVASFFEALANEKQMRFILDIPETLLAQLDVEKVQRALLNLLSNAFKFTPNGGSIRLTLEKHGESGVFSVEDSGPGVDEPMIPVIFERFRQVEGSSSRRYGGTGLGLSIVKEFTELHEGHARAENVSPHGLKVTIEVPLKAPVGQNVRKQPQDVNANIGDTFIEELGYRANSPVGPFSDLNPNTPIVLIVEDNDDVREFLQGVLSQDYRVITARNGLEGLAKAKAVLPTIIIADIMMPHMSGEEMVKELRHQSGCADIPVVMLSARADESLRIKLLEHGVQDFITKPFIPKELLARVGRIVSERRSAEENLKISEERYRNLVEATTSVVWTTNSKGEIETPQTLWLRFTGQTAGESIGWGWLDAIHPDDRELLRSNWWDSITSSNLFLAEGRIWSAQHKGYRFFLARGISLRNMDGSVREWVGTINDVHERTTMEQRLRVSVQEKDILLKEMHHRVKNNMQVIASLLGLQAMNMQEAKLKDVLQESQRRIRAMALVHERLYQSQTLSKINFGEYLTLLVQELFINSIPNGEQISLDLDIDQVELGISKAIPCGLLINELLSNSLKHAFPNGRKGKVKISLKTKGGDRVLVCLADDGVGMPTHLNPSAPTSLGLQIVNTLSSQLGAELTCKRDGGVEWTIQFETTSSDEGRLPISNRGTIEPLQ